MSAGKSVVAMLAAACLCGCASPDVPTPRHAIVPLPVNDLAARQVGDTVILNFTLPTMSTDMQSLADTPSVEIYRNTPQAAPASPKRGKSKSPADRLVDTIPSETIDQYQKNGRIEFPDKLDPNGLAGTGTDVVYTVKTSVSRAKWSANSNAVSLRIYPPPHQVQGLRATVTETAIMLDWTAPQESTAAAAGSPAGFRVYRAEVDAAAAEAAIRNPAEAKPVAPPVLLAQVTQNQYRDTNFQFGHTYLYIVREVEQFGSESLESADSAPAVLTARDIFPPASPKDLEAVVVPATPGAPGAIELTWTISPEPDLAGYNVYRSDAADERGQKLNSELLLVPTFRDMSVVPGKAYFYRVGAVDQSGNESPLTSPAEARAPGP